MKRKKNIILSIIFSVLCVGFITFSGQSHAQNMSSENFHLQGGNLNITSGNKSSENFKLSDVVGQTAAGMFVSKGYTMQAGFLNSVAASRFSLTVIPLSVDFGSLSPNTITDRDVTVIVSTGESPGYRVWAIENHPLSTLSQAEIPDTTCDGVNNNICTITKASVWTKNTTYGFGYRMKGNMVPSDFNSEEFFRPFPSQIKNDDQTLIMQSQAAKITDQAIMNLRVNVGPDQSVGQYRNEIIFSALAGI
ncbi:hypothetical protein A2Y99_05125 [Candidatus Gottesmanbacteria bacterium RBG_13_37_7]|uniref:Uncharacterized protein n=1 Tax=Candidatus Gottesmanbacteria bacterium RBG_13_37_7 TaxID=1798369 RepID=A0A1F5YKF6_9BACT|nr:MAG: hypothetical protein A2Y99_05125 [Candidatus Gottesmanbacteria bacterium RBG_13_37_7]